MNEERFNIKQTIYLNRTLDDEISEFCKNNDMGFNSAIRYLLQKALQE